MQTHKFSVAGWVNSFQNVRSGATADVPAASSSTPLSLEEKAARALIAEASGASVEDDGPKLVIGGVDAVNKDKKMPLLLANVAPELSEIKDDVERYRMDISIAQSGRCAVFCNCTRRERKISRECSS